MTLAEAKRKGFSVVIQNVESHCITLDITHENPSFCFHGHGYYNMGQVEYRLGRWVAECLATKETL